MFRLEDHIATVRAACRSAYGARLKMLGLDVDDFVGDVMVVLVRRRGTSGAFHAVEGEPLSEYGSPRRFFGYVVRMAAPVFRDLRSTTLYRRQRHQEMVVRTRPPMLVDECARFEAREQLRRARC
jgi:hypothetical protein